MRLAFVGCGFVAPLYFQSLSRHPELELVGVYDRDSRRCKIFCDGTESRQYESYEQLLNDSTVEGVVNLTNPPSHYEVISQALDAGKHVYSEKPLSMCFEEATQLTNQSKQLGLELCTAPTLILSEAAQTLWKALRDERIGAPRLALAEIHDGFFAKKRFKRWKNMFGIPWPYLEEFHLGCSIEHAAYFTTWLTAFWGPAIAVTAFGANLTPQKGPNGKSDEADFSCAMIEFGNGAVARLTASIVAPTDRSLTIIGDEGILRVEDCWKHKSKIHLSRRFNIRNRLIEGGFSRRVPLVHKTPTVPRFGELSIDFAAGIAEMSESVRENRRPRLNCDFGLHNTELTLVCAGLMSPGIRHVVQTTFDPIPPMPWADENTGKS